RAGTAVAAPVSAGTPAATKDSPPDRWALAEILSRATGCVVVLKGHRTAIADGGRGAINQTGNPAMATAGMGDVLTGVIAALIGQGLAPAEAAVLGVHIHGLAGDMAAQAIGPAGLLSTDVANLLPKALATRIANS
ncbi:sugar kinase, partial [mine drainage metagenome]